MPPDKKNVKHVLLFGIDGQDTPVSCVVPSLESALAVVGFCARNVFSQPPSARTALSIDQIMTSVSEDGVVSGPLPWAAFDCRVLVYCIYREVAFRKRRPFEGDPV